MRIQKYLSEQGILSRREAERYILKGLIKLNGAVVKELGVKIDPAKDKVEVIGPDKADSGSAKITIAFNKPRGVVCTKAEGEGKNVFDVLPQKFSNLNSVGRLDKESEGLLILSNDGIITAAITGENSKVEKEYEVRVLEPIKPRHMKIMERGMQIESETTLPAKTEIIGEHSFRIILKEGKRHQIRRMCAALGLTVSSLRRVRIGSILLKGLGLGQYRVLESSEVQALKIK